MYESFFQFRQRPFLASPNADRYFPSQATEHARQTLIRCIERSQGPGLIIGPAGTGKSLLCQLLGQHFRGRYSVAILANSKLCTRRALLQSILFELNLPYRDLEEGELRLSLIDHLDPAVGSPNGLLLIIDEAHTLPFRLLEELRMITNLVRAGQPRVSLVMAGGPQLEERFANPKLDSFNQRIAARCYLQPLSREETYQYVRAQISAVGGNAATVFSEGALRAVFVATDGVPRLINQVCDYALLLASVAGKTTVEAGKVEEAWADLQQLPTPWQTPPGKANVVAPSSIIEYGPLEETAETAVPNTDRPVQSEVTAPISEAAESATPTSFYEVASAPVFVEGALDFHPTDRLDEIESQMSQVYATEYPACYLDDFGYVTKPTVVEPPQAAVSETTTTPNQTPQSPASRGAADAKMNRPAEPVVPANPFGDFQEEEVVIDRFGSVDDNLLENRPLVSCLEGREFAAALYTAEQSATKSRPSDAAPVAKAAAPLAPQAEQEPLRIPTSPRFDPASDPVLPETNNESAFPAASSLPQTDSLRVRSAQVSQPVQPIAPTADADPMIHSFVAVATGAQFQWPTEPQPVQQPRIRVVPQDDRDLIVVEDESATPPIKAKSGNATARRQEYRQLFAKLRQG